MKLVFINDQIYKYASRASSAVGGAERQQWLLARALVRAGWSVTVGVSEELAIRTRISIDGVNFVGIGHGHGHVFSAWWRFLVSERPDWCYWRGADFTLGLAVEMARLARVRTIFSTAFDSDVHPRYALSRRAYLWPLYAWGLSHTEKIFVQHSGQLAELPAQWRSKASIVSSIAGAATAAKPHSARAADVAWVGMLRQPKRPDLLIEIAQKAPDIHFIVCGAPNEHRSPAGYGPRIVDGLHQLANIELLGQVPAEQAQAIIANAAVLLSTADGEGFPNTFLQAWSSGTPVVSLSIDPDRVIERLKLGVVSGNVENTIMHIRRLLASPERREEIAARARKYVETAHDETVVVAAFESALGKSLVSISDSSPRMCHGSSPAP